MKKVKILFVGDIVGDPGMGAIRLFLKNFIKNTKQILLSLMVKTFVMVKD